MKDKEIRRIGVVGLGKMGLPMASLLVSAGYSVTAFDVSKRSLKVAKRAGIQCVESPAEVAKNSDLVLVIVGFESEVDQVMFGALGLVKGARKGLTVAICATVSPQYMRALPGRLPKSGSIQFLDTPLCRGEWAAHAGELLIMAGGRRSLFEACTPVFRAFATSLHYLGDLGAGQVGKMINNLILWACLSADHEGLRLAGELGVSEEPLRRALLESSATNWALDKWQEMKTQSWGTMPWAEKDMTIVLQIADQLRLSLPLCGVVKETIKAVKIERGNPMPTATS